MTRADMDAVVGQFVAAARLGLEAGFDMIELHAAHGYLLSSFITPLTNRRDRRIWRQPGEPAALPAGGVPRDARGLAGGPADVGPHLGQRLDGRARRRRRTRRWRSAAPSGEAGADLIDVSAGQTWADCQPVYGRMFQTPFADQVRNEGRRHHHGGRQHLRARSRQLDPRRRPRRPGRAGPAASDRSDVDAARRRAARIIAASPCRRPISAAWPSSPAIWQREAELKA